MTFPNFVVVYGFVLALNENDICSEDVFQKLQNCTNPRISRMHYLCSFIVTCFSNIYLGGQKQDKSLSKNYAHEKAQTFACNRCK